MPMSLVGAASCERAHLRSEAPTLQLPPVSSSGLGRHPFKVETTGSNPVTGTHSTFP